jgi:osmotically-inducible protein OsmY
MEHSMKTTRQWAVFFFSLILLAFVGCAGGEKSRSTGQVIDDTSVTARVKNALLKEPGIKATDINVDTYAGQVQLSGFVASEAERRKAAEIARKVEGVKAVRNDIRLKPTASG